MSKFIRSAAAMAVPLLLCTSIAAFAAKPKPKAKPAPKPSTTNHAKVGTQQLKGEYADMGSTYTLGKDYPINITLKSAEYSVSPLIIGESVFYPNAESKLLVLHYNIHNPQSSEAFVRYDTVGVTVVDSKGQNHEGISDLGAETSKTSFCMSMKPAQKADVYTAVVVPADGEMPKLMLAGDNDLVLRYDLRGKVKPLAAPFADPKDSTGATALAVVPAQPGTFYPISELSFRFDGAYYSEKPIKDVDLGEDSRFLIVNAVIKNEAPTKTFYRGDTLPAKLIDADGAEAGTHLAVLLPSRDAEVCQDINPGQELKVRYIEEVPKDATLKTLSVSGEGCRAYEFDISAVK